PRTRAMRSARFRVGWLSRGPIRSREPTPRLESSKRRTLAAACAMATATSMSGLRASGRSRRPSSAPTRTPGDGEPDGTRAARGALGLRVAEAGARLLDRAPLLGAALLGERRLERGEPDAQIGHAGELLRVGHEHVAEHVHRLAVPPRRLEASPERDLGVD